MTKVNNGRVVSYETIGMKKYHDEFHRYFGETPRCGRFVDKVMILLGEVKIDVGELDKYLHEKFGNYDANEDCSMAQLVEREYGKKAVKWVRSYF